MSVIKTYSFLHDALIRNELGKPMGRIVLAPNFVYEIGAEFLNATVLKVLKFYCFKIQEFKFYVDGNAYKVPEKIHEVKLINDKREWIVTNIVLTKV